MEWIELVAKIIDRLWDSTARRVKYFAKIGKNMDNLLAEVRELTLSRADLESAVERAAELEGKVPTNEVQGWLDKADKIIKDVEEMQEEFQRNKKCFYGWCLDCPYRYKLGKRIVEAAQEVQNHIQKKNSFHEIAVPPLPESVPQLPTTTIREGTSTMDTLGQVWNWLMDAKTGIIGIWGKGGVGKTTLVKNINKKLHGNQHFEVVIFVTVSRDWNIKKLRNDIGNVLELSKEEDETRASRLLFDKLRRKRFLLILDDMWEKVDLEKLGVPSPKENGGCKIIITTRDRGVCNAMETDEEIMVQVLSDEEAWELFKEKAGNVISSGLEPIARNVCKECRGLPLAIIVVGRALRKEADEKVWEDALEELKTSRFNIRDMKEEVYLPLKFSYDRLKADNLRHCFLYCSLFPEDYEISVYHLIEYWTMEGFVERSSSESLQGASRKGHSLLKELIDSCLLEKENEYVVKVHDVIRDMAIKITSDSAERGRRFLVQAGVGLESCPEVEKWEGKDRISLMDNDIRILPDEPKCTQLSTLLLQGNFFLPEIPESFFKQMKNLRLLDLSRTGVMSLPPSISELGNLQALILRECGDVSGVAYVGGLEQLQLLDLCSTKIKELPREIGKLTRLRRLNLSQTKYLAYIPADIIVSLSRLEDLEMLRSSYFYKSDKPEALIENLRHLNHLTHFSAGIPDALCTSSQWEFLLRDKLKSFHVQIGKRSSSWLYRKLLSVEPERRGRFVDIANVSHEAVELLQYSEMLQLFFHRNVRTISALGACNLKRVKKCFILGCNQMENVVITEEAEERILPNLEILVLAVLPNLRSIWEGNGTPGSFGRIKYISLYSCNVMYLFSFNVLQLLNSLEELTIVSCLWMVEIVTGEIGNGVITLPKLTRIVLHELPKLNRMWEGVLSLESLQEIQVTSCTGLRQLGIDIEKTQALKAIKGESEWWDGLEWQNDSSKFHFQNIFTLVTRDDRHLLTEKGIERYYFR